MAFDRLGHRLRIGLVVPAFNTTMQPELEAMRPPGVTNHVSRIMMPDGELSSDADQTQVIESLGLDLVPAIRRVALARPGVVILGISIPTFWNGVAGLHAMKSALAAEVTIPLVLPAEACLEALSARGDVGSLAILTPYQPIGNAKVSAFFEEAGYRVAAVHSLEPPRGSAIAELSAGSIRDALARLASSGADMLLQVGTNIAAGDLVEEIGRELGKPLMSINTLCYWSALRHGGLRDTVPGFGAPLNGDHEGSACPAQPRTR